MVWGAATSLSSGGRSAVQTMSGTSAWWASITAAWKWAPAGPLEQRATAGRPVASPSPSAMNAAERSSWWTWTLMSCRSARASAKGVDRDPGAMTASVTPARAHSSTRVAQNVAAVVTGMPHSLAEMAATGRYGPIHVETTGSGSPRLVLVHGFTQTGRSWGPIAGDLAADHEVVIVDAPGHGDSAVVD